jgi:ABC-type transporter MlaC component
MRHSSLIFSLTVAALLSASFVHSVPVLAQCSGSNTVQELVTLFSAWSSPDSRHSIFVEAARHIDYNTMAEMAFQPKQWDSFSPLQKREVVQAFRTLVETRYYQRWHKLFLRSHLTIASEAKAGGDIFVKTYVAEGKDDDDDTVIWRLRARNGELMVISMDVNGKDFVNRLSSRFQKQLKKRGPEGLISWLKDEADEDEVDVEAAGNATARRAASR